MQAISMDRASTSFLFVVVVWCSVAIAVVHTLFFLHLETTNLHVVVNMACCVWRSLAEHINAMVRRLCFFETLYMCSHLLIYYFFFFYFILF